MTLAHTPARETSRPGNRTGKGYFTAGNPGKTTGYRSEIAVPLAEAGITQAAIAAEVGCDARTVERWRAKYPEFRAALVRGLQARAASQAAEAQRQAAEAGRPAHEAALALRELVEEAHRLASAKPPEVPADADEHLRRLSERRAARQATAGHEEPQEPQEWQGEAWQDGEPVELDDPRAAW
ncbi:helix-turn-helix domain-containing protein [Mesorhizobium huakuii]|uniref:Helix-turn-helix domain-containing protein n=1 Tax=Mesorhizobium huakuii TaxID=28104 RepID=A0A7G6SMC7_9HYPH|nr:helix-turn-helix domain-containing protein [Mesorhizobium huakuii]